MDNQNQEQKIIPNPYEPPQSKPSHKLPTALGMLIVALVAGALGFFIYTQIQKPDIEISSPSTSLGTSGEYASWKTYKNEEYGFEVKYPQNFYIVSEVPGDVMSGNIEFSVAFDDTRLENKERFRRFTTVAVYKGTTLDDFLEKNAIESLTGEKLIVTKKERVSENPEIYKIHFRNIGIIHGLAVNESTFIYIVPGSGPDLDQILSTFKFIEPAVADWKTNTLNTFLDLSDWRVEDDAKDYQGNTLDLGYCGTYKQNPNRKVFRMSKVFNIKPFSGDDIDAELNKAGAAQEKLAMETKNAIEKNGWTLCTATKDGEVGSESIGFYKNSLYFKGDHVLHFGTGTRNAVLGGMYVEIGFEY